jgi:hypothetical protein
MELACFVSSCPFEAHSDPRHERRRAVHLNRFCRSSAHRAENGVMRHVDQME